MNDKPHRPVEPSRTEAYPPPDADSTKAHPKMDDALTETHRSNKQTTGGFPKTPEIPGYETLGFIARGGMGYVLKARHQVLNRLVAIKLPLPGRVADDDEFERFLREARAAARLQHPHICPIHEVGEIDDGQPYITLAYIEGETLGDWVTRRRPTARETCELLAPLCRAVHYAHEHEVLHRDIKPSNIMVGREDGRAMLMDFGLAKELTQEKSDLTQTGQVMGTPAYMAPEQAAGNTERVGTGSDVYALGAVLYHVITGRTPFSGSVGEIISKVQNELPVSPRRIQPRIHRDLETIILKAMAKEPADRYETAAALADDLERFCAGESILARREGLLKKTMRYARRHPVAVAAIIILLVVVGATGRVIVREQKVDELRNAIEREFDSDHVNRAAVERVEPLLERWKRLDAEEAALSQQRLYELYGKWIEDSLRQPNLTSDDIRRIEEELAFLETRDKRLGASVRKLLEKRLSQWQPLFELNAPFENLETTFENRNVRVEDNGLVANGKVVLTNAPCEGNVRLMACFDERWKTAKQIGLYLGISANGDRLGYLFQVVPVAAEPETLDTGSNDGADATSQTGKAAAQIFRDGQLLREDAIEVGDGPLRVTVSRRADRLVMQVNELAPIEFFDTFSLAGDAQRRFGAEWPANVRLVSLQASALSVAQQASPLESGDDLYGRGQYSEALAEYEKQAIASAGTFYAKQAQLKQALCLIQLEQLEEACARLEQLGLDETHHIRLYALGQLWVIRLQQERYEDAYAIFESLSSQDSAKELRPYVPETVTRAIINHYHLFARGIHQFAFNSDLAERLHSAVAVEGFFGIRGQQHDMTRVLLSRAYMMAERYGEAMRMTESLLRDHPSVTAQNREWWFWQFEQYCWLLRLRGDTERALQQLEKRLLDRADKPRPEHLPLLVERARIQTALDDKESAKKALAQFHRLREQHEVDYLFRAAAYLLEGFILEQEGDTQAAQAVWRKGLPSEHDDYYWLKQQSPYKFVYALMLSSLTGEFSESDVQWIFDKALPKLTAMKYPVIDMAMRSFLPEFTPAVIASISRNTFRSERGRDVARRIAFRKGRPIVLLRDVVASAGVAGTLRLVFDGAISQRQEQVVAQLARDSFDAVFAGELTKRQLFQAAFTWKGITSFVGWESLAPTLDAKLRGPLAYLFGVRYLKQFKRPADARKFFQTAVKDAGQNAPLRAIAEQSLAAIVETEK